MVVKIHEGINPPYVCNGTIYVRSGSSKVPIKSDRSAIDELVNKRNKFHDQFKEFCINKFVDKTANFPYCTIYLFNTYKKLDYEFFDERAQKIRSILNEENKSNRIIDSIDSVIRVGSEIISESNITSIEEYFINGNIKIYVPLFKLNNDGNISEWIDMASLLNPNIDMKSMTIIDGMISCFQLFELLQSAFKFIKRNNNVSDYNIVFEYKNIRNVVFYHRCNQDQKDEITKDIQKGKINICYLSDIVTKQVSFKAERDGDEESNLAYALIYAFYLRLFGINTENFSEILAKSNGRYDELSFKSELYQL